MFHYKYGFLSPRKKSQDNVGVNPITRKILKNNNKIKNKSNPGVSRDQIKGQHEGTFGNLNPAVRELLSSPMTL